MSDEFMKIGIGVEVDTSDVQKQLDKKKNISVDVAAKINTNDKLLQKQLEKIKSDAKNFGIEIDDRQAMQTLNRVQRAYDEIKKELYQSTGQKSPELTKMAEYYKELEKQATSAVKAQKELANLNLNKQGLTSDIDSFLSKNTKLDTTKAKELKQRILEIRQAVDTVDDSEGLKNLGKQFTNAKKEADTLNLTGKNLGDEFLSNFKKFSTWVGASAIFFGVQRAIKGMVKDVIDVNTAMTSLRKVTDATEASFNKFLNNATKNAKDLGTSITDLIDSTAEFARLGYGLPDAEELGKVATLYKNVGDGITATQASQSIISTMKAKLCLCV